MSLVVSVAGKIESYHNYKKNNLSPVTKTGIIDPLQDHEDEQEFKQEFKHENPNAKPKNKAILKGSYGKQPDKTPQRKSRIFAKDIMSFPVRTINKETTVLEAVNSLNKFKNKHLLISEAHRIIGIVSDRDLLRQGANIEASQTRIQNIMSNEVIMAKEDAEIKVLANIMLHENISAIPIIDDKNQLVGIVTQSDLLRCIMNNMPLDVVI